MGAESFGFVGTNAHRREGGESALLDQKRSFPNRGRSADLYELPL